MRRPSPPRPPRPLADVPPIFRPRDLAARGISRTVLRACLRRGDVERLARGVFRRADAEPGPHETIAEVCARAPRAIVCLLTALSVHEIGTQSPRQVWIAIDRKARRPALHGLPVRVVRFSGPALRYGVVERAFEGVPGRITTPARTIVDCFRYRNKVGLDVALEALEDGIRSRHATFDEIARAAEACRVLGRLRPYLEALSR